MCNAFRIGARDYPLKDGVLLPGASRILQFKQFFCLRNENMHWRYVTLGSLHIDGIWEQGAPVDIPEGLKIVLGRDPADGLFGIFTTTLLDLSRSRYGLVIKGGCLDGTHISELALSAMDRCARRNNHGRTVVLFESKVA